MGSDPNYSRVIQRGNNRGPIFFGYDDRNRYHACGEYDRVVAPHERYLALAESDKIRRKRYRRWFRDVQSEEELSAMRGAPQKA